ncbi:MAG: EamA family transporter [Synergistaceae bacterium]|nr:EamA family transporter [Synergistaceae bacterium]
MWSYYWPIGFIVFSNVLYHICSKSLSGGADPYFSLLVTYIVAALICLALYLFTGHFRSFCSDVGAIKWNSLVLGVSIVCLELGFIMMYRAGWNISIGSLIANICLAAALVVIGVFFYRENLTLNNIIGMILCISGLIFINI